MNERDPEHALAGAESAPANAGRFQIRPAQPADLDALYRVCLLTGDSGNDASAMYRDPMLLGHVYVGPYVTLEPDHAFALEDTHDRSLGGQAAVVGYVLGAFDTTEFSQRVRSDWLPPLQARYPAPTGDRSHWTRDQRMIWLLHHAEQSFPLTLPDEVAAYPSHLHIDLLPQAQRGGQGRRLIETLLTSLKHKGSVAVHLGVGASNTRAQGFYRHLGFAHLGSEANGAILMGSRLK